MRRSIVSLAVPLAFLACDTTRPVGLDVPPRELNPPLVSYGSAAILAGGATGIDCLGSPPNNAATEGAHFDYFALTLGDAGHDPDVCGDLVFDNRVRTVSAEYSTDDNPEDNPYKYWWRRGRLAEDGTSDSLVEVLLQVGPAADTVETGTLTMPLYDDTDAIGMAVIITNNGDLEVTDSAFLKTQFDGLNYAIQHWREIPAPTFDSASADGTTVTLYWTNEHEDRDIDSTMVFRDGVQLYRHVGHTATTFTDTVASAGSYTYSLKHFTIPAVRDADHNLVFPNSDASSEIEVDVFTTCAYAMSGVTSTWQNADQYLSAGCSDLGSNKRYRWKPDAGGSWTAWSADTLYDFLGHSQTGTRIAVLEDSNTTTYETGYDTLTFSVSSGQVSLSGPTYITDKKIKTYTAGGHSGQWFERYDDGPTWFPATAYDQTTMTRIWPYGQYTVDLRQHKVSGGVLHRGRLFIEVCSAGGGCAPAPPAFVATRAAGVDPPSDWGVFGAGPWIAWGDAGDRHALRLYDLWGMHDRASAFADATWIDGTGGAFVDGETVWDLTWSATDLGVADVRAFTFTLAGTAGRAYRFGMAIDPDLGPGADAADDVATFDSQRGMVIVADADRALGLLLRRGADNAIASVQEYGVGRFAPTTEGSAWAAQRTAGVWLLGTPRDVQLVLSTAERSEAATWQFVVIRGATAASVQATADEVLRRLR